MTDWKNLDIDAIIRANSEQEKQQKNDEFYAALGHPTEVEHVRSVYIRNTFDAHGVRWTSVEASMTTTTDGETYFSGRGYGVELTKAGTPHKSRDAYWRNLDDDLAERIFTALGRI